mgnify:CR=1 FL=1
MQHGFDDYFGLPYSNDMWPYHPGVLHLPMKERLKRWPHLPLIDGNKIINPQVSAEDQEKLTTQYTERAVTFIEKNKDHDLAGSAQYWYGETFRIRQLYSDAATAYLDGYQNYPKSKKAPDNLLKLGITMVELGEKDQGCKMISGLKKEYPKASKSVLQKAQYEQKKFKCKS